MSKTYRIIRSAIPDESGVGRGFSGLVTPDRRNSIRKRQAHRIAGLRIRVIDYEFVICFNGARNDFPRYISLALRFLGSIRKRGKAIRKRSKPSGAILPPHRIANVTWVITHHFQPMNTGLKVVFGKKTDSDSQSWTSMSKVFSRKACATGSFERYLSKPDEIC